MISCSLLDIYRDFRGLCCLRIRNKDFYLKPEDGSSMFVRNIVNSIGNYTVSQVSRNINVVSKILRAGLRARRPRGRSSSPGSVNNFHFSISSRPALRTTQPPIQWVPGLFLPGVKRPGRELTTHLHVLRRSRKCGSIGLHPLPHTSSWRSA
jgi:hypothetical protein